MKCISALKSIALKECPRLPQSIHTIYIRSLLVFTTIYLVSNTMLLFMKNFGYQSLSGSYYRILEPIAFLIMWLTAYFINKKYPRFSHIYATVCCNAMLITLFEINIYYNGSDVALIYYAVFSNTSLVLLDFFKKYWIMVLYQFILSSYVYTRAAFSGSILGIGCYGYWFVSLTVNSILNYIYTSSFNLIFTEKAKSESILNNWKEMMHITPIGIIIGSKDKILFQNDISQSILVSNEVHMDIESIEQFINKAQVVSQYDTSRTIKGSQGTYIYCVVKDIIFSDEKGKIIILNDITKVMDWQNQKHEQEMVELLVATSTHEMRTPLHCIKNTLLMLQSDGKEDNEFITRAIIACDMQECYINDMLDFAKFKKNTLVAVKEPICVNDLLNEIGKFFTFSANESNLNLTIKVPNDNLIILADYTRLKQILFNLISNAFKFTTKGGITIKTKFSSNKVIIEVKDTGVGIKKEDLAKLFQPFSVLESTRSYNKSGTGLGLYLSQKLCELMGSKITAQSTENIGTKFIMTYDLHIPYQAGKTLSICLDLNTNVKLNKSIDNILKAENSKALIVDDNGFNLKILEKMLILFKIQSYKATNGNVALSMVQKCADIRIAFIDLNMPIMDGFHLIDSIQRHYSLKKSECPFIMFALTGESSDDTKKKCFSCGFTGFLIKPFTKDSLRKVLAQYNLISNEDPNEL